MKALLVIGLCIVISLGVLASPAAAEKPVLGVAEFHNAVGGLHWWSGGVGWDLSGMLSNELVAGGSCRVVERSKLEHVLNEQDLADYGRVAEGTGAEIGKLTGAQYLVLGTVSAYEENVKGTGGGIGFKGIRVGGKKGKAYMLWDSDVAP